MLYRCINEYLLTSDTSYGIYGNPKAFFAYAKKSAGCNNEEPDFVLHLVNHKIINVTNLVSLSIQDSKCTSD